MQKYAREDTHYLLYIYDCLRKQLLEKGAQNNAENPLALYKAVLHRSNGICLKVYEKPVVKDFNYHMIVQRNQTTQSPKQLSVLKGLWKWRDYVARTEDESTAYCMPNYVLFQIARDLPSSRNELKDSCRGNMSPVIFKYQDELIEFIAKKKLKPSIKNEADPKKSLNIKFDDEETKKQTEP